MENVRKTGVFGLQNVLQKPPDFKCLFSLMISRDLSVYY